MSDHEFNKIILTKPQLNWASCVLGARLKLTHQQMLAVCNASSAATQTAYYLAIGHQVETEWVTEYIEESPAGRFKCHSAYFMYLYSNAELDWTMRVIESDCPQQRMWPATELLIGHGGDEISPDWIMDILRAIPRLGERNHARPVSLGLLTGKYRKFL